jgi:putative spermidine/putrescine transport system permease protein
MTGVEVRAPRTRRRLRPRDGFWLKSFTALIMLSVLLPLGLVILYSFSSSAYGEWPPPGLTLRWYDKLLTQSQFVDAFFLSLSLAVLSSLLAVVTGVMAAVAVTRASGPFPRIVQATLMSPLAAPKIAVGLAAFFVFREAGIYGSFRGLWLVHTVLSLPFAFSVISAGLIRVNPSLEEAARDMGANSLTAFTRVVLPQIRRSIAVAWTLSFIMSFDEFEGTILVANPTNPTLPISMFHYLEKFADPSMASLSTFLILGSLGLIGVAWLLMRGAGRLSDVLPGSRRP